MKTKISRMLALTVLAYVVIIISSSSRARAANYNDLPMRKIKSPEHIHKLVVDGNVNVYLSQGTDESLSISNKKSAVVRWKDGVVHITSFNREKVHVSITVTNLSSIEASGMANVRSMNELSTIDLDIRLKDKASAQIEAQAVNISGNIEDHSRLDLSGESENQHLGLSGAAKYEATRFTAQNRSMVVSDGAAASVSQQGQATSIQAFSSIPMKKKAPASLLSF